MQYKIRDSPVLPLPDWLRDITYNLTSDRDRKGFLLKGWKSSLGTITSNEFNPDTISCVHSAKPVDMWCCILTTEMSAWVTTSTPLILDPVQGIKCLVH